MNDVVLAILRVAFFFLVGFFVWVHTPVSVTDWIGGTFRSLVMWRPWSSVPLSDQAVEAQLSYRERVVKLEDRVDTDKSEIGAILGVLDKRLLEHVDELSDIKTKLNGGSMAFSLLERRLAAVESSQVSDISTKLRVIEEAGMVRDETLRRAVSALTDQVERLKHAGHVAASSAPQDGLIAKVVHFAIMPHCTRIDGRLNGSYYNDARLVDVEIFGLSVTIPPGSVKPPRTTKVSLEPIGGSDSVTAMPEAELSLLPSTEAVVAGQLKPYPFKSRVRGDLYRTIHLKDCWFASDKSIFPRDSDMIELVVWCRDLKNA